MTSSNLTLLIVLYQIRERFEVDSFIHDFECHPQRRNDPEQGVDRHVFTGFQVNNRFAIALGFVRQLLLAITFSTAQQAYSLAEGWGIQNQHNVTYIGLLQVESLLCPLCWTFQAPYVWKNSQALKNPPLGGFFNAIQTPKA
jgi:hypothetical protein